MAEGKSSPLSMEKRAIVEHPSLVTKDEDHFTWIDCAASWTIVDQRRLNSINHLYNRSLEFHNNHHSFRATLGGESLRAMHSKGADEIVIEVHTFTSDAGA